MAKRSVKLWLLASVLALPSACALGDDSPMLAQDDLKKPDAITAWLKENGDKADKARAKMLFDAGVKAKGEKRSGPAGKAFVESAIFYPTPEAISEYADIKLRMLGEIRERSNERKQYWKSDLSSIAMLYRSVLAADGVLNTLSAEDKQRTRLNAECIGAYVKAGASQPACAPLQAYGIK